MKNSLKHLGKTLFAFFIFTLFVPHGYGASTVTEKFLKDYPLIANQCAIEKETNYAKWGKIDCFYTNCTTQTCCDRAKEAGLEMFKSDFEFERERTVEEPYLYTCLDPISVKTNDFDICVKASTELASDCPAYFIDKFAANGTLTMAMCDRFLQLYDQEICVEQAFNENTQLAECNTYEKKYVRRACIINVAKRDKNLDVCKYTEDSFGERDCYEALQATSTQDIIQLCNTAESVQGRNWCLENNATYQNSNEICALINDYKTKNNCLDQYREKTTFTGGHPLFWILQMIGYPVFLFGVPFFVWKRLEKTRKEHKKAWKVAFIWTLITRLEIFGVPLVIIFLKPLDTMVILLFDLHYRLIENYNGFIYYWIEKILASSLFFILMDTLFFGLAIMIYKLSHKLTKSVNVSLVVVFVFFLPLEIWNLSIIIEEWGRVVGG